LGEAKFLADMLQSTSLDLAKAVDLVEAFQDTLQDLRKRKFQTGIELSSLLEFTIFLEPLKEVFYQLFRLCCIAVRSFSALKLIKTHLRTTMTDDRLSNLGVLSIEVRRAKCLDLDDFVRRFASHHRNRRIQLF
uniref:Uncharacterized protein n=1 Tax=Cyprinus carpio TaxID=7962 RepID=A0A8C1XUP7_CYPCA